MNRRLLLSYASLIVLVLVVLEVPLGIYYARNERTALANKVERDAVAMASLVEGALEHPRETPRSTLQPLAARYHSDTGARALVVDARGFAVADSARGAPRSFASRPEIARALSGRVARGVRYSHTLGLNLLYVAVPVASSGTVRGAVRITYPRSAVDARVRRYWLVLLAVGAVAFALALVLATTLARWISRPLREVEAAAEAAGAGDLGARAPTDRGPPEVRELGRALNETVAKLEQLLASQREFIADASHQLRTPLTALRLRLENLEPHARPDVLGGALREVDRLSRLVESLLELARADAVVATSETVDLRAVVEERLDAWSSLAAEAGIRLEQRVAAGARVRSDPARLEQVLDNLIANALDAAPPGSSVEVWSEVENGAVALHVRDEGRGMTETQRRRAFDRFWRGEGNGAGSGLGLAIVRRLVAVDGGTAELRAADGGGTDAVIRLRAGAGAERSRALVSSRA